LQSYLSERFYPENAERFVGRLVDACESLRDGPFRGTLREDIGPGIRSFGFERRITVFFTISDEQVVILRISYRGRTSYT
jgi:toxin ParE1/3/4